MGARNALATSEFNDVVKFYPDDPLSGNALFYLGEIDYRSGHFASAIKNYDRVLDEYPGNNKIPASHLHKGEALLAMHQNEAGIRELRVPHPALPQRSRSHAGAQPPQRHGRRRHLPPLSKTAGPHQTGSLSPACHSNLVTNPRHQSFDLTALGSGQR